MANKKEKAMFWGDERLSEKNLYTLYKIDELLQTLPRYAVEELVGYKNISYWATLDDNPTPPYPNFYYKCSRARVSIFAGKYRSTMRHRELIKKQKESK